MNTGVMQEIVDAMLARFQTLTEAAEALSSPNPEDTLLVKCAIVGFSEHSATENWGKSEFDYVVGQLADGAEDLTEGELQLKALCLGALCGLWHKGTLAEGEFQLAEMHLPGLIMLHAGTL